MQFFGIRFLPQRIYDFFLGMMKETIENRTKHNIIRPDLVHLLLEAKKDLEIKNADLNGANKSHLGKSF